LATGTYTAVLNGINSSNIISGTSGVFGTKLWTLTNPTGTQWNLVVTENVSPIIGNLNGDQVAWAGVGSNVTLDVNGNATLSDENFAGLNGGNGDWAGATLTVQRPTLALTSDVFGFDTAGAPFTVSGSNLQSGGLTFATFTNTNGVLAISFTSSGTAATTALVNSVAQRITYRNDTPAGDANIRFALNDGSGTAITNADVLVTTDLIYITNSTNTATIDLTDGISFSEAIAIAAADVTGDQQLVFASNLANTSLTVGTNAISENLIFEMDLASGITLAGGTLTSTAGTTLTFSNGTGDNATITAVLAGDGAIKKSGLGVVNLRASNTFRGITTIAGGTISIGLDDNLGTPPATPTPGHLVLENGGILKFVNVTTAFISVNSNRGILLNGTGGEFDVSSSTEPSVSSIIAGTGSLTKSGPSQIRVDGMNTYSGGTTVNNGTLFGGAGSMTKTSFGVGSITINATGTLWGDRNNLSNPIILNGGKLLGTNGFGEIWNGPITLQTDSYIQAGYAMIINGQISGPGKLILNGSHPTNSRLILTNAAIHTGGTELTKGVLQMGNNGLTGELLSNITTTVNSQVRFSRTNTFTYPGIISGPGGVNKISAGTVILSGVHTYTGTTLVEDGTLLINGSTSSQTNVIPVANRTGTLGGIGTINGNVSLQTRGILNPGNTIGALTINGNLTMVTGSTFAVDLNGATVGTENDQIVVNGTVDITGATLTVNHNNTGGGTLYTILVNDQSDAVTGTFNGIAEGTLITAAGNGALLSASYTTNGTGNDIVFVNRFSPVLGRGQTANVLEPVSLPPTVQISNSDGTPASNTTVTFTTNTGKVNTPYLANSASWYTTGGSLVTNVDWKAHVFTTGNDPVSIDQISVVLNSPDPTNFPYPLTVTAEAALYQVSNGVPTQEIQSSGSQTVQLNASGTWKNFDFATPVSLSPQTQYAIVVKSGDATGFKWANVRALSTVAGGVASTSLSLSSANGGGQWTTAAQNNAYALRSVTATASSVTVTTNANGIAALGKWVLGDRQGTQTLTVTSASLPNNPLTFTATAVAVLPSAPTNLVATPGLGSVSIAFTSGYDGGANLSNYQYSLNNGSTWTALSPSRTTSPVTIPGLTSGVTYSIQLRGVNSIGQGAASAAVSATPIKAISDPSITVDPIPAQIFTGSSITPTLLVKDGNTTLTAGTDYSVVYSANTNVGTANGTITGLGRYNGTRSVSFTIVAKAVSTLTIDAIATQTYTGSALTPALVVKDGNTTLTATTDYTVAYTNNANVGTATVTITGVGNYSGTKTQTFTIAAKAASTLTLDAIANQTYTGSALTPAVVVKDGNTALTATTDYTVAYTNNTNVGTATVTITGVGNYSGTKTQTFTIGAKAASTLTMDAIANQTYLGSALTPALVVKDGNTSLTATTDYTVAYTNNTNVGTATVTITGVGNYTGTKTQTFTIVPKAASTLTLDAISNQTYTGSALTPAVVVKDGNTTLTATTDYTVAYANNTIVGTATVTITGVGNYTGTKTQTFTIVPKASNTLTIEAIADQTYTGSALTPAVVVKDGSTTLTESTDYTIAYTNNTNVGTATVTITGAGNYTGTKTQTFTIVAKAASTLTIESIANLTYTGEALTPNVVVKDGSKVLTLNVDYSLNYFDNTNAGTASVQVIGLGNYSSIKVQTFSILPKQLIISVDNKSKIYGDANPLLTFSYKGLVPGDSEINELPTISTSATASSPVGDYVITLSGGADPNYVLNLEQGVLSVKPANLTLRVNSTTKVYGQIDPLFTFALQGLKGLDTEKVITGSLVREVGENPGVYAISLGNVSPGSNYNLTFIGGTLEILIATSFSVAELETVNTNWSKVPTLPKFVDVGTTDGQYFKIGIDWDTSALNLLARGTYTLYGALELPVGIENPDGLKAQIQVVVLPKPSPRDVTINNSVFEGSTTSYFIPVGAFVVNDPVDNVHVVSLFGDGYDNTYFEIKDNILFWSSADRAAGKTTFSIVVRVTDRDGNTIEKFFTITRTRKDFNSLTITNAYTPNGDGANDAWGVPELRFYEGVRIQIFDQGGNRLFYTENPDIRWDGTFEGKAMPVGSYYWVIEILETGEMRKGMLNLIRK
jgi:gliding motility-associated-like protein